MLKLTKFMKTNKDLFFLIWVLCQVTIITSIDDPFWGMTSLFFLMVINWMFYPYSESRLKQILERKLK